jgi:hypothetical protein
MDIVLQSVSQFFYWVVGVYDMEVVNVWSKSIRYLFPNQSVVALKRSIVFL